MPLMMMPAPVNLVCWPSAVQKPICSTVYLSVLSVVFSWVRQCMSTWAGREAATSQLLEGCLSDGWPQLLRCSETCATSHRLQENPYTDTHSLLAFSQPAPTLLRLIFCCSTSNSFLCLFLLCEDCPHWLPLDQTFFFSFSLSMFLSDGCWGLTTRCKM